MRLERHSGDKIGGTDGNTGTATIGPSANSCALAAVGAHANMLAIAHGKKRIIMKPAAPSDGQNLGQDCALVKQPVHKSELGGRVFDSIDRGGRSAPER
jgi:hypothetical protein